MTQSGMSFVDKLKELLIHNLNTETSVFETVIFIKCHKLSFAEHDMQTYIIMIDKI